MAQISQYHPGGIFVPLPHSWGVTLSQVPVEETVAEIQTRTTAQLSVGSRWVCKVQRDGTFRRRKPALDLFLLLVFFCVN